MAGISVDFALFPIDTIKSRLQASSKQIDYMEKAKDVSKYRGFLSAMLASFPCAAMFWVSYEFSKY
jgi:solute carrier family 25 S-adenosylmethionine transporter 26